MECKCVDCPRSRCTRLAMNRSRTMGSAWILGRFAVLPLGSSSTSAATGLLVRQRSGDGVSWSPPDLSREADTMRELAVVEDMLHQSSFPDLLLGGPTARSRMPVWWPAQTNRQGDGGPFGPHIIERGGCQINRQGRSLADEALHREAAVKHFAGKQLFESEKTSVSSRVRWSIISINAEIKSRPKQ